jgi:hypothetical protein
MGVAALGLVAWWQSASGDDPSQICGKPEVVKIYYQIVNPMGLTDEQIKAAGVRRSSCLFRAALTFARMFIGVL